jgi:hypothetical protein
MYLLSGSYPVTARHCFSHKYSISLSRNSGCPGRCLVLIVRASPRRVKDESSPSVVQQQRFAWPLGR